MLLCAGVAVIADVEVHSWVEANTSIAAIASGSQGTITFAEDFDCDFPSYIYQGNINIEGNVTVHGNGAFCNARRQGYFFYVDQNASLALDSITLSNSSDLRGAILNTGHATITHVNFTGNYVDGSGAAIQNGGTDYLSSSPATLLISYSNFIGNWAYNASTT